MSDIFISYSRADSKFVETLVIALIDYGWSVWTDKSGISEGGAFDQQTEDAISEAAVTLVIWSEASVKSRWVRAEASFALNKNKLIPVLADGVDPPLQFVHIQGVNFANWGQTSNEPSFKKLSLLLSERLDRLGRIPRSPDESGAPQMATAPVNQIYAILKAWRNAIFPPVGRGFDEYFTSRTFHINQFACVFAFALVTLFGLLDLLDNSGGVNQTRFRLMVTGPTCLIFLGLSFTPLARRNSQTFIMAFGCVLILLVYKMMQMVDGSFPVTTGAPTTTFLILMSLMTVLPLRTANAVALGFLAFLAHAIYTLHASVLVPRALLAGYWICVFSTWAGSAVAAYFRERAMRKSFLELDSATSKIAELKERVVALAVERHQLPSPHIGRRKIARPQVSDDRSEFGMG